MGSYSFSGAPEFVTVGATGVYDINAFGAQGGGSSNYGAVGGMGAEAGGVFNLTTGEQLEIVVGGVGGSFVYGGGGGGGTFVLANTGAGGAFVPLLVAGGGGGGYRIYGGAGTVGVAGSGAGGGATGAYAGGGGSGVNGNGTTAAGNGFQGVGGDNLSGSYAGGEGRSGGGDGGFGGGGGGGLSGGGGGGGYTGGSTLSNGPGLGGTSFDAGTAIVEQTVAGVRTGDGGLTITPTVACYCPDTLILTNRGEMPVEVLAIGDTVVTASGKHRPIKWIGRRSYAGRFLATNSNVHPIRFRAGSLGGRLPRRDLLVSPEHAMFLDGILIPAKALVNGSTITQQRGLDQVDYFHVELDGHDMLLAEGAPSESFLEDGNRGQFHNAAEHAALYPDASASGERCALWVDSGAELEAIRARLAEVAGEVARAA